MSANKNVKWIVIGCIVLVCAVLIAFAPILVTKYMRTKWEEPNNYKSSALLMNIFGQLAVSKDNVYYLKGNNNLYYVLENINQDISKKVGNYCSVLGKVRVPKNNETIENNKVRLFIGVNKIVLSDKYVFYNEKTEKKADDIDVNEKNTKKAALRAEINAKLKTRIMFDVVKGKVNSVERTDKTGNKYISYILTDDFNDKYMLYKKDTDLSVLDGKEVACLGRQIMPPNNMFVVIDEMTFEIYEVYNANYKKLI